MAIVYRRLGSCVWLPLEDLMHSELRASVAAMFRFGAERLTVDLPGRDRLFFYRADPGLRADGRPGPVSGRCASG